MTKRAIGPADEAAELTSGDVCAETKTVEEWAALKGYVNEPPPKGHALDLSKQREWIHLCAVRRARWAIGKLVTEAEYDAAVSAAMGVSMR
jgi:hypothetical protein